jgi:metal-dependent amidase/aminoacylase/carboxypeptidase family protein
MSLADRLTIADDLDAWLRETRHMIHINPELMLEEHQTSELVRKHLTELGVSFRAGVGGDGRPLYLSREAMEK